MFGNLVHAATDLLGCSAIIPIRTDRASALHSTQVSDTLIRASETDDMCQGPDGTQGVGLLRNGCSGSALPAAQALAQMMQQAVITNFCSSTSGASLQYEFPNTDDSEEPGEPRRPVSNPICLDLLRCCCIQWLQAICQRLVCRRPSRARGVPEECPQEVLDLYLCCLSTAPAERPQAAKIVDFLLRLARPPSKGKPAQSHGAATCHWAPWCWQ